MQIKAVFTKERAKFEVPSVAALKMLHLDTPQMKLRSVTVNTQSAGGGNNYELPVKPDYSNPIEIVHFLRGDASPMRFATRNGDKGQNPLPYQTLGCIATQEANSEVAKIQVWYNTFLLGIRFMTKDNDCVLSAGQINTGNLQEIPLQSGERLVAFKSKLNDNSYCNS